MIVKIGESVYSKAWTKDAQAIRYGNKHMPDWMKRAGWVTVLYHATSDVNGWDGIRINYSKP